MPRSSNQKLKLMVLADIFEVSVDVLLGYELQSSNVDSSIKRIESTGSQPERPYRKSPYHAGRLPEAVGLMVAV